MTGSVRTRLTAAVVLVVGVIATGVAMLAPGTVEDALVDARLDAEVSGEAVALRNPVVITGRDGEPLGSPELTALFGPDIASLAGSLDEAGALEPVRSLRSDGTVLVVPVPGVLATISEDGRIRVDGTAPGDVDGPLMTGARLERLAGDLDPASVFDGTIDIFADRDSVQDVLDDINRRLDGELGELDLGQFGDLGDFGDLSRIAEQLFDDDFFENFPVEDVPGLGESGRSRSTTVDQLAFGTRSVDGVDVVVAASTDGIDITTDRLRTWLWIAVPVAMLLTGLVSWVLAGRALRPVRAITDQTGRIRTGTLHERVPVPSGHDEVAGLATEMNDMLDRLEQEDRRRRQFVADASHELRSPIASIHTQAEVALRSGDVSADELAGGVLAESDRLAVIVDDLLSLARHDETLLPPGSVVDLDDVVLEEARRPRRVPVETGAVSAGRVRARPDELARVVRHLLDNAARHAAGTVRLSLQTRDDRVLLHVDDDGDGVPDPDRDRIFERFVRLDDARARDAGGAGLGLSVVDTVVRAAGGAVTVGESRLGGARFTVDLPAA